MNKLTGILVVDDEPETLCAFAQLLNSAGYEVWKASTGRQGLELAREKRPDLALVDVVLPDLNGIEVCRQIKSDHDLRDVFVVLISGDATKASHKVNGLESGADDYMVKPVDPEEFLARIRTTVRLKGAMAALRQSQERYRTLAESSPDAIFILDQASVIQYVNSVAVRWLGKPDTELLGRSSVDFFPPEIARQHQEVIQRVFATGELSRTERNQPFGGIMKWIETRLVPLRNQQGEVVSVMGMARDLTEQKQTEEALQEREELSQKIIDSAVEGFWMVDLDGNIVDVNEAYCRMSGFSREELVSKHISDMEVNEPSRDLVKNHVQRIIESGSDRFETRHRHKNGQVFEVEVIATFLRLRGHHVFAFLRDITERKRAERVLQASEERFRQLADNIREVFWMTNPGKNEVIYISPAYEEIWGRPCESLYASPQNWIESLHPDDCERVLEAALTRQITGQYDELYRIIRPDGTIRWIQDRAFPIRDDSGKVYRVVGIAEDVTKRKQAEDALRENEARKSAIMRVALDGIITIDHVGRIIELNAAAETILTHNRAKLIGEDVREIIPPSLRAWFQKGLANSFAGEEGPVVGSRIEMAALRADGSRFAAEFTITRIQLRGQPTFTVYIRDITQRKRAEEEMRLLPQRIIEAQEAERLRVARELHDGINQIIASAKMRLHKVLDSLPELKPAAREILARCDQLLVKALEENRRIAHNLHPSDLDNLGLSAACRNFCREFQSRTDLQTKCRIAVLGRRRLSPKVELNLFRIVQEAINNIEKHAHAKTVKLHIGFQGNSICMKIQDDGRGFNPGRARVNKEKRSGLGLTNMRERAAAVGGTCTVASAPGKGTIITVHAPCKGAP